MTKDEYNNGYFFILFTLIILFHYPHKEKDKKKKVYEQLVRDLGRRKLACGVKIE
jgi:hypothetical protein